MKFLYADESGEKSHSQYFVMAGIMVDAVRLRKRTEDINKLWADLIAEHPSNPRELKTTRMINGKGDWSKVCPDIRKKFVSNVIDLALDNGGKVFAIAIDHDKHDALVHDDFGPPYPKDKWAFSSLYLACLIQKKMEKVKGKKGLTVFIMDHNKRGMPSLTGGLYDRDPWFDGLYSSRVTRRGKTTWGARKPADRFDQIVNTAFAIDSQHSTFVQVADVLSYLYRRKLEIEANGEAYAGEKALYDGWVTRIEYARQKIGQTQPCDALDYYRALVPDGWAL